LSIEETQAFGNIGYAVEIEQSQKKTVQDRQDTWCYSFAYLAMIFAQRHMPRDACSRFSITSALFASTEDRKQWQEPKRD